jgi:nuclear pore complex protein Nup155
MALNMPPATPQRQGPGVFPQTPARPPPFSAGSLQQQQAPAPVPSQIQLAARAINRMLDNDNRYPPLEAYSKRRCNAQARREGNG